MYSVVIDEDTGLQEVRPFGWAIIAFECAWLVAITIQTGYSIYAMLIHGELWRVILLAITAGVLIWIAPTLIDMYDAVRDTFELRRRRRAHG